MLKPASLILLLAVAASQVDLNLSHVCTVTGNTVITFSGVAQSIHDRCNYNLMETKEFTVMGGFKERRRKDVSFLDKVTVITTSGRVSLEQGGRVQVNNSLVSLSAVPMVFSDLTMTKTPEGVTAFFPLYNFTVFFDGYTAHLAGTNTSLIGLCNNANIMQSRIQNKSGCEIQYPEDRNDTINCNLTIAHCNLVMQQPFTACHSVIDPTPYFSACTNVLCSYPTVDDLRCQLVEAYSKACVLKGVSIGDWRSTASCSPTPLAFCQDKYCTDNEFCGNKHTGELGCLCRAIFASPYNEKGTLGNPTVCSQSSAAITLIGCLLEERGINYTSLHLKDDNCKGQMDKETHLLTFSFDYNNLCNADVQMNNTQIIYTNTITSLNVSSSVITRSDQVSIDFSCYYTAPELKTVGFRIKDSSVVQQIVAGIWNYTLKMNAYMDEVRTHPLRPNDEIRLNQKIWMELATEGLDSNTVAMVTDSCWATNLPEPNSKLRYDLIMNKCPNPADQTVMVQSNGQGTSNYFSFNMFEFSGKNNEIYLHCRLELCLIQSGNCVPGCNKSRRRRSVTSKVSAQYSTLITMAWTN